MGPDRGGLPWYFDDNGKCYTQSCAIIRALAAQHGYVAADTWKQYDCEWVLEMMHDTREQFDFIKPAAVPVFSGGAKQATDEEKTTALALHVKMLDALENLCKDGRKYLAGDQLTAADFNLLSIVIGAYMNPNGKDPAWNETIKAEYVKRANVKRVMDGLAGEKGLPDYIKD